VKFLEFQFFISEFPDALQTGVVVHLGAPFNPGVTTAVGELYAAERRPVPTMLRGASGTVAAVVTADLWVTRSRTVIHSASTAVHFVGPRREYPSVRDAPPTVRPSVLKVCTPVAVSLVDLSPAKVLQSISNIR
jgi:hypothetical protein